MHADTVEITSFFVLGTFVANVVPIRIDKAVPAPKGIMNVTMIKLFGIV